MLVIVPARTQGPSLILTAHIFLFIKKKSCSRHGVILAQPTSNPSRWQRLEVGQKKGGICSLCCRSPPIAVMSISHLRILLICNSVLCYYYPCQQCYFLSFISNNRRHCSLC
ncbi:hypothetical protein XENTR_v10021483 [Xenopus tropicalis]|nr:hypothetical protein XENTR_v10021483 [Xenopus tropicalis]